MKKTNIIYWIITGLFLAFMLFSGVMELRPPQPGQDIMAMLGYPPYLAHFLAVTKFLGVIAILIPGFPRIKEWAYAGFAFDLIGASYSMIAVGQMNAGGMIFMLVLLAFLAISYIYYHKRLNGTKIVS